jgi:hypothetical protein
MSETITQTISDYIHAMTYGDAGLIREVFDPRASIVGNFEGATEWLTLEDFIDQIGSTDRGLPDRDPAFQILGVDTSGDSASAKLTTTFAGMNFSEYLSLLQRDRNWTIVHKLYYLME